MQWWWSVLILGCGVALATHGVIFETTADPAHNTSAPSGPLEDSGWQYQGRWGDYLGTVIAPRFFLTADHVKGNLTDVFWFDGLAYHPVRTWKHPGADLRLWEVAETFPRYAPLFTGNHEIGLDGVLFGRGTRRGPEVILNGQSKGWRWGGTDKVQRWGQNTVAGLTNYGAGWGEMIRGEFTRNGGSNQCHLSVGDSSGAWFLLDNGTWKLAGLHVAVDGPFSNAVDNTSFHAALLDRGGLHEKPVNTWIHHPETDWDNPSSFYSLRISAYAAWIHSLIDFRPGADWPQLWINSVPGGCELGFQAASNRLYRIETTTNLVGQSWRVWTNNLAGPGWVSLIDSNSAETTRFYRLGAD